MTGAKKLAIGGAALVLGVLVAAALFVPRIFLLVAHGEARALRPDPGSERADPRRPKLLILALDGVDRSLLYSMLRSGELPELAGLLGGSAGARLPHACLDEQLVTVLPSTTIAAWTTVFTGVTPGEHGITGNEFFDRASRSLYAPAPVSLDDISPVLELYTNDTLGKLLDVPTVYEQLREREPHLRIWVAMSQIHRGADRLLLARRNVLTGAFTALLREELGDASGRVVYSELDEEVLDTVIEELEDRPVPDVLTLYIAGTDLFAHHAKTGPDPARRGYLREVLDPKLGPLRAALTRRHFLPDAHIVVLSDHGHTPVAHDDRHALSTHGADEPPELLRRSGFRVRPFEWKLEGAGDFQAVLAYNGAIGFAYLADRSTCREPGTVCDWDRPPRFHEDVLPAADAFLRASAEGALVPALKDSLDLVLVRNPDQEGEPFLVHSLDGTQVPPSEYLQAYPHPTYVALASRLRDLGTGPHGDRAGDVVLVANNGNRSAAADRFYFASLYRSWHGSPSRQDSEVPFIVAHSGRSREDLCRLVQDAWGSDPKLSSVAKVLLRLRSD